MSINFRSIEVHNQLTKLKGIYTARNSKAKTYEDVIKEFLGPTFSCDISEDKADEFIKTPEIRIPWLKYFKGESKSGEEGVVGIFYYVRRENASFPRYRE